MRFGGVRALDDVALRVEPARIHCLIGHNGAGKTTLFNVLAGSLRATSGRIAFQGRDIAGTPAHRISRLGLVRTFQRPRAVPTMTIGENLALAIAGRRAGHGLARLLLARGRDDAAIEAIAGTVRLPDPAVPASELSHGLRKRLELGIALACEPAMLLLDEPTAGMNAEETAEMADIVRGVVDRATVLLIEHDLAFVRRIADRVTVLHHGAVLTEGSIDEVERHPTVREVYLGGPA
jgi:ABC-type branched-subunit amino acid transport system ATPase component